VRQRAFGRGERWSLTPLALVRPLNDARDKRNRLRMSHARLIVAVCNFDFPGLYVMWPRRTSET